MAEYCEHCGQPIPEDNGPLANLVRRQRMKLGYSLRDVERITNGKISNAYLSQIETGKIKNPSLGVALTLAAALGISFDDLAKLELS